jgi:ADP-ribose pyrophosphatase YjhB (NUDIX family)
MGALMQIGFHLRRFAFKALRLRTRGVKVMVFNPAGEILLIRNSYGRSDLFALPGGGIGRSETPDQAAAREVKEETGLGVRDLALVSIHGSTAEGKRDTIHLFSAIAEGAPIADGVEVDEARFFPLDALPDNITVSTLRRIAERGGDRAVDGLW